MSINGEAANNSTTPEEEKNVSVQHNHIMRFLSL